MPRKTHYRYSRGERIASEEVILDLVGSKCVPSSLYWFINITSLLNKTQLRSQNITVATYKSSNETFLHLFFSNY